MEDNLQNIVPFQVFKEAVDSLRTPIPVVVSQSGSVTTLTGDFSGLNSNSFITCDCGDLQGEFRVKENGWNNDKLTIDYSGNFIDGTIEAYPYFYWGSLMKIQEVIQKTQEYPLVALVLPDPYTINTDSEVSYLIDDTFKLLLINKFSVAKDSNDNETQRIYDNVVAELSNFSLDLIGAIESNENVENVSNIKRSEEIPFGITITSNQSGKTAGVFDVQNAGCYLEMRVSIYKSQNCN